MSKPFEPMRDTTVVLLDCGECGAGHYAVGLGGGQCVTCGHTLLWSDVIPNLDPGESPAVVQTMDGHGLMAYRIADDTREGE